MEHTSTTQLTLTTQSISPIEPIPTAQLTPTTNPSPSPEAIPTAGQAYTYTYAYYVSPSGSNENDGSQAHPFATIQKAADVAQAGTLIHVLPGTYTNPVDNVAKGTATARITFKSDVKWGAKIETTGPRISWTNYGDYVDIVGFDLSGDGVVGIDNLGSFVQIIGNHTHNYAATSCDSNGAAGIENSENGGNHDNDVIGNVVNAIGPPLSMYCNFDQGIYHSSTGGHIFNNIVYSIAAFGIHMWHGANSVTIANNLVFECGRGGILIGANETLADNFLVVNNISIHNHKFGIDEYASVGPHNRFLNNLVYANPTNLLLQNKDQGTLTVDPQLVNYQPDGSGDYHLSAKSPAIGAGTSIGAALTDINGVPRPQRRIDLGPYL